MDVYSDTQRMDLLEKRVMVEFSNKADEQNGNWGWIHWAKVWTGFEGGEGPTLREAIDEVLRKRGEE